MEELLTPARPVGRSTGVKVIKVDVTYYPFDTQTCFLKMGSWTYSGKHINLDFMLTQIIGVKGHPVNAAVRPYGDNPESYSVNESIDLQVYLQNGEWDLMNTPGTRVVTAFGDASYHELYYYIHIKRRTLAYGINLIIPSLVISMMTVLGFTLPPDACEKITLETTVLLSVIFFLQMVSNMSPPQSKSVPILAAFFSCCLMVVACSCVFTVLTLCLYSRKAETHEMSPLMRRVFVEWLPYILMMRTPDHPRAPKAKVIDKPILPIHRLSTLPVLTLPRPSEVNEAIKRISRIEEEKRPPHLRYFDQFCEDLKAISTDLEKITSAIKEMYEHEMIVSEWRFAAMAVDRMCLYLFSIFIAVSTCGIIMPHIIT
ncbi:hypothetical protein RB195_017851 [Necator americanus]|uniref:Neurotransmitter-gated ion-channel ligand binding domain protein n=1 Tax=Necator americanus TaxID=51031 RepID=A0ABR1C9C9_NECAM